MEEKIKKRFLQNGEKVFFVDGSKSRALACVNTVLSDYKSSSFLCLAKSANSALQIKRALFGKEDVCIISKPSDVDSLLISAGVGSNFTVDAQKIKEKSRYMIVVLEDSERNPVLHKELGVVSGKSGEYNDGDNARYCFSDLLADAQYQFVLVDEVYEMFRFSVVAKNEISNYPPQKYDRIDLMGQAYFTSTAYSYRRVSKIVDSAKQAVLISDILFDRDVVSVYAGINLINGFSYNKARNFIKSRSSNYNEEIDLVCGSLSYCCSDDSLLSLCLQYTKGKRQRIPSDLDSLSDYLTGNLDYLTHEETFLRTVYGQAVNKYNLEINSNSVVINSLEQDESLVRAVCDTFFNDEIKGDIESNISNSHTTKMNSQELDDFLKVINKYVEYCDFSDIGDRCEVVRIFHDESAFEHFMRAHHPEMDDFKNAFSVSYRGNSMLFKSLATELLLEQGRIKTPLVVLTEEDLNEVVSDLSQCLKREVKPFSFDMEEFSNDDVIVMDHKSLDCIGTYYNVGSVVFFDILADVNFFDTCIKKMLDMNDNTNAVVIASYNNLSGMLADTWQKIALDKEYKVLPIRNTEIYIKGETPHDYKESIKELNGLFESFRLLVEGEFTGNIKDLAERFSAGIANFTLNVSTMSNVVSDFEYMKKISKYVDDIFGNSISVKDGGREAFREIRKEAQPSKKRKKKKQKQIKNTKPGKIRKIADFGVIDQGKHVLFNLCAKQLHETCNYIEKDCCDCEYCNKFYQNDFELFSQSTIKFFEETDKVFERMKMDKRTVGGIISGASQEYGDAIIKEIIKRKQETIDVLSELCDERETFTGVYYADFYEVEKIRENVKEIYAKVFDKYYLQLQGMYENMTSKMRTAFLMVGTSAKSTLSTL